MISFNPASPPADLPATLDTLSGLVALLADPAAAKERVAAMQQASAELQQAIEASRTERANFALAETAHREALDRATAEHSAALTVSQAEADAANAKTKSELDSRADQLAQLQAQAETDAEAAAATRANLERRLALLKEASAA